MSTVDSDIRALIDRADLPAAATRALAEYGPKIMGFLWVLLHDDEAVDECYAQFSESLWRVVGRFRGESSFKTYCFQIAFNTASAYLREPYRKRGRRLQTQEEARLAPEQREPTQNYRRTTNKNALSRLRARLEPEEQTLLSLRIDQRMSWHDIAVVLAGEDQVLSEAALRKRFERLKSRLRKLAEDEGLLNRPS